MSTILTEKYFPDMPKFPSIKPTAIGRQLGKSDLGTVVNIWHTPQGTGALGHIPAMANLIFHNRRVHTSNLKRIDPNTYDEVIVKTWVIPFTVDPLIPLVEITQRLDAALDKLGLYTNWKINYNDYNITAIEHMREDQEAAAFIAAEKKKEASRYGYFPKLHPSEWKD